jgi:probable blue pigment (indigoidine) exporter
VTQLSTPQAGSRLPQIGPALLGASSFACADVVSKVALTDGADVLTISTVRAVIGVAILFAWLQLVPPSAAFSRRATWVSLGLGVLFAPPATASGWLALIVLSAAVTTGLLGVFASTVRIGPFRTALFMNLEPLLTAIGSALFLGEVLTPLHALGGGVMIAALVAFQVRR